MEYTDKHITTLKNQVYKLYDNTYKLTLEQYNNLIKSCVNNYEMAAVVFIYDHMKNNNTSPNDETYNLISKLHSKTVQENNEIYIKNQNVDKLQPRRRIHKIIKGYNYSDNYKNALIHLDKVKTYLDNNPDIKLYPRIKLANTISKKCSITLNDARYIITNLKKTKFINDAQCHKKNIDDFTEISKIHNSSTTLNNNSIKQTSITNFFHVIK